MSIENILAATYLDRCDIYRNEKVEVGSITRNKLVKKYEDVKCALSSKVANVESGDVAKITVVNKLFTRPNIDLIEGDVLMVTQQGMPSQLKYTVESLFVYYNSHTEATLKRVGYE